MAVLLPTVAQSSEITIWPARHLSFGRSCQAVQGALEPPVRCETRPRSLVTGSKIQADTATRTQLLQKISGKEAAGAVTRLDSLFCSIKNFGFARRANKPLDMMTQLLIKTESHWFRHLADFILTGFGLHLDRTRHVPTINTTMFVYL